MIMNCVVNIRWPR